MSNPLTITIEDTTPAFTRDLDAAYARMGLDHVLSTVRNAFDAGDYPSSDAVAAVANRNVIDGLWVYRGGSHVAILRGTERLALIACPDRPAHLRRYDAL